VDCNGTPQIFTITVNPTAQVNDPVDQVVCNSSLTAAVNFTTSNSGGTTTYSWTNDNTTIGLAANGTGNIAAFTAINAGTSPVIATITVTPTFTNGSVSCTGTPQSFTITVNPSAQVDDPADQVVCNGSLTNAVNFSTGNTGGTTTFSWTNNQAIIGLAASGTGNIAPFTALNAGTAPIVATITITPTYTNAGVSCTGPTQSFTITVNPSAQVNDPADQIVCNGASTAAVNFTSNNTGGTIVFNWTNDNTSIGLAASGTGNIPSFTATNPGTAPVTATLTVTATYTNGSVTCTGIAQTFTITVNPTAQVDDPADQVVCNGGLTVAVNFTTVSTGGATTYNWTNDNTTIGLGANGTGNIGQFTAVNTGTSPVVATITVTPSFTNGGVACTGPSQTFTITVNPSAQMDDPADQVVCAGDATAAVIFTSTNAGGTTTFSWINDNTSIGLVANGTGNIPSFTALNAGATAETATITVTPTFTNGGISCSGAAETFTITVNPTPTVNPVANQTYCNGNTTAIIVVTGPVSGTTFTWANDTPAIGLAANGTGNIPSFTATNPGSTPIVATITITPSANGCTGTPFSFTITVNPATRFTKHSQSSAILPQSMVLIHTDKQCCRYDVHLDTSHCSWNKQSRRFRDRQHQRNPDQYYCQSCQCYLCLYLICQWVHKPCYLQCCCNCKSHANTYQPAESSCNLQ